MRGARYFESSRSHELRSAAPPAEQKLWSKLRGRRLSGFKFVRQDNIGPYFIDFLCREKALIIEVDGATHSTEDEIVSDRRRESLLRERGFQIVRVTNDDVLNNLDGVCETIRSALA
jgi:very-short-patch-repair endonuclease